MMSGGEGHIVAEERRRLRAKERTRALIMSCLHENTRWRTFTYSMLGRGSMSSRLVCTTQKCSYPSKDHRS